MTLLALQSHNYILHFLLLDANIYHDFNTRLHKTKRQDTVVKGFACFIFVSKPPDAGCLLNSRGGWFAAPALAAAARGEHRALRRAWGSSPEQWKSITLHKALCHTHEGSPFLSYK